jgi:dGTPase
MEALLNEASTQFIECKERIFNYDEGLDPLMEESHLCDFLKRIAQDHAFSNTNVLKAEAIGAVALGEIMSFFWNAISDRKDFGDISSRRKSPAAKFGWSLVSSNYIEQAETDGADFESIRYAELRLLTDMVSGMTDTFAMKLWKDIKALPR